MGERIEGRKVTPARVEDGRTRGAESKKAEEKPAVEHRPSGLTFAKADSRSADVQKKSGKLLGNQMAAPDGPEKPGGSRFGWNAVGASAKDPGQWWAQREQKLSDEPKVVDRDFVVKDLGAKSRKELQSWYESRSPGVKQRLKAAVGEIDRSTLDPADRKLMDLVVGRLNDIHAGGERKEIVASYGKMPTYRLTKEIANMPPEKVAKELELLASGKGSRAVAAVEAKFRQALEAALKVRVITPSVDYPTMDASALLAAAKDVQGPGAASTKAIVAALVHKQYPKHLGGTIQELILGDPAGVVHELQNLSEKSGFKKVLPGILTRIAKAEYDKNPEKGAEVIGKILGAVATEYAEVAATKEPDFARSKELGRDLGFVLAAAEISINSVADGEKAKIAYGAKVLSFATDMISRSDMPGASQVAKVAGKATDWLERTEKQEVDDWKQKIYESFRDLIHMTYDSVSPYGGYQTGSEKAQIHERGRDVYQTTFREGYREVMDRD